MFIISQRREKLFTQEVDRVEASNDSEIVTLLVSFLFVEDEMEESSILLLESNNLMQTDVEVVATPTTELDAQKPTESGEGHVEEATLKRHRTAEPRTRYPDPFEYL
ncbi:hypothetical protein Trydic_g11895 [Trypoxylus dichotomus]